MTGEEISLGDRCRFSLERSPRGPYKEGMDTARKMTRDEIAAMVADVFAADDDARTCPHCGTEWLYDDGDAIFGCDLRVDRANGERFLTWRPCCAAQAEAVEWYGYADAYGLPVEVVAAIIDPSSEVLEVIGEGDGTVVARLVVRDPAVPAGSDGKGHKRAASPKGWRDEVFSDVAAHHSHHPAPQGHKFSVAVYNGSVKVGVAVVGRPVSRVFAEANPDALEVTRVAVWGHRELRRNAVSKLYAAAAKKTRELGYKLLVTYTLDEESGHSLVAAGWTPTARSAGGSWSREGRERTDVAPTSPKTRWEKGLSKSTRKLVASRAIELPAAEPTPPPARLSLEELRRVVVFEPAAPVEPADPRQGNLFAEAPAGAGEDLEADVAETETEAAGEDLEADVAADAQDAREGAELEDDLAVAGEDLEALRGAQAVGTRARASPAAEGVGTEGFNGFEQ